MSHKTIDLPTNKIGIQDEGQAYERIELIGPRS